MDIRSIHAILSMLGLSDALQDSLTERYIKDIVAISKSIESNRRAARESEQMLSAILDNVETGIGFLDSSYVIQRYNKKLGSILSINQHDNEYINIMDYIPKIQEALSENKGFVTTLQGEDYLLQLEPMNESHLLLLEPVNKIFRQDHEAKRSYEQQLRTRLYNLEDYLTIHDGVKKNVS